MAGPWPVRFVAYEVLAPFRERDGWGHAPAVLKRATEGLGYVPCTFWHDAGTPPHGPA